MRKPLLALSLLAASLCATSTAFAAVQYEFRQTNSSDSEGVPVSEFTGRAVIDGERSRVDFLSGNYVTPGSYVIAGARQQTWVDPIRKVYQDVDTAGVAAAMGAGHIAISNKSVKSTKMDDRPTIAGIPTDHYRTVISYDITVYLGSLPVTQSVTETVDRYMTTAFGDLQGLMAGSNIKTGNPSMDELISSESASVKGFALREVVALTTINHNSPVAGSPVQVNRSRTQTREFEVTSIEARAAIPAALFYVPASYQKANTLKDDAASAKTVTLEPSGN
jgi:hypothetical protein